MAKPKQLPLPTQPSSSSSSSSSYSSSGEDSPPPAISAVKKPPPVSTTAVLQKHIEPFPKSFVEEKEEKESSESKEGSTEDDSSEDSEDPAAKSIPPPHPTDSRIADVKQGLKSPSPDTESDDGEEVDSSSDSEQQPPPPPSQATTKVEGIKPGTKISRLDLVSVDESETSSDSDTITPPPPPPPPRISSRNTADPSLKPLSSKPMDSPVQATEKSPISKKRSIDSPAQISEKKRKTVHAARSEGGQEKKEIIRRIWSKSDELVLLQCVLDCIEHHHGTSTPVQVESLLKSQAESLLKSVNASLSSSITLIQMSDKIRRLRLKYKNTAKKVKDGNNQIISNANDAAIFDLSKKIWDSSNKEPVFSENKVKTDKLKENINKEEKGKAKTVKLKENIKEEKGKAKTDTLKDNIKEEKGKVKKDKLKENIKEDKGKANHFAAEYPFLSWHAKNDHVNSALIVHSRIPTREAEELEESCKKLEISEVQLHMKKMKLLSSSLKLIEDALAKL